MALLGIRLVVPNLFWQALTPVFHIADALTAESQAFFAHFSNAATLAAQNEKLTNENATLASENAALQQKVDTQNALFGGGGAHAPGILADVAARPPTSPYDTLVLSEGSKSGITLGMEVFGPGNVPVGVISSVLADFSQATLFSTPGVVTHGWVGHANLPLMLTGAGAGALNASVPRAANIAVGDTVFMPGPGQLPVGGVVRVDSDPLSPAVTLRIVSAVNPFSIAAVVVRATGITGVSFATSTLP